MNKHFSIILLVLVTISKIKCQDIDHKPVQYPSFYKGNLNVVYKKIDNWEGRMDIYNNPTSAKPTPIVINIHGGGWNHGSKESQTGFKGFFEHGFAVANVEYRLVNIATAPAAIEDIRCALNYLIEHSEDYNIDPNRIVLMGGSSGGHLALMTGLLGNNPIFDSNCEHHNEIEIVAIIDKYAPTDLGLMVQGSVKRWLADNYDNIEFINSVSPLYYVNENSPPTLIIHGSEDPLVSYQQSQILFEKMKELNVKTEMITIEGGGHGKFSNEQKSLVNQKIWEFLETLQLTENY